jgi:hypothetical protein
MVRFQTNCVFKIYKGAMQRKNMNMNENFKDQSLQRNINKLIIIGYKPCVSIMLENKQRQNINLI